MGATVGASMGVFITCLSVLQNGSSGVGLAKLAGKSALRYGTMFALLMGTGGLVRCRDR